MELQDRKLPPATRPETRQEDKAELILPELNKMQASLDNQTLKDLKSSHEYTRRSVVKIREEAKS